VEEKNQVQLQASSGANLYSSSKLDDFLAVEGFNASSDQLLLSPAQAYGSFLANVGSEPGLAIYEDRNSDKDYNNDDEVLVWLKGLTAMPAISFGAAAFAVSVTFRKVVTPWLPFRRPESMVTPGPVRSLPVAC